MTVLAPDTRHVDKAVYASIAAAVSANPPAGGVRRTVPSGTSYPYIKYMCASSTDNYTLGGRAWGRFLYQIDVWDKSGSAIAAQDIAGTVAYAFMDSAPAVTGGRVVYLRREQRRETDPSENGIQYQRISEDWVIEVVPT